MDSSKSETSSVFSEAETLKPHDESEDGNSSERRSTDNDQDESSDSNRVTTPTQNTSPEPGRTAASFGPKHRLSFVSNKIGFRFTWTGTSLYENVLKAKECVVVLYSISSQGDELAVHIDTKSNSLGWSWRSCGTENSPTYSSLKSWIAEMVEKYPTDARSMRVVFGPGATYFASCGEKCVYHDLPKALQDALFKLPNSRIPRIVAFGPDDIFFAVFGESQAIYILYVNHDLYKSLKEDSDEWKRYDNVTMSPHDSQDYIVAYKLGGYGLKMSAALSKHAGQWLRAHTQQIAKENPQLSFECSQMLGSGTETHERLDAGTNFQDDTLQVEDKDGKLKKEETTQKTDSSTEKGKTKDVEGKKTRRFSRLFTRSHAANSEA